MQSIKTLTITSCTGEKRYKPEDLLLQEDFKDSLRLKKREEELKKFKMPACNMYTGMQHLRLMEGIAAIRGAYGHEVVDLYILSAGYGLIHEDREIVPYELTFKNMVATEIKEWARFLNIKESLSDLVKGYNLVFFLLGDDYLRALELPLKAECNSKLLFLASKTSRKLIPQTSPYYFIEVGQDEAKSFGYGLVGLKGYLMKLFSQEVVKGGTILFEILNREPRKFLSFLEHYRKKILKRNSCRYLTVKTSKMEGIESIKYLKLIFIYPTMK